jgi:predicted RNA binding protein YcfA (HicA-like mRNA interferase family)
MKGDPPAISGNDLIRLLQRDGWECFRTSKHGAALRKYDPDLGRMRITTIPTKNGSLPSGTLGNILSPKQTGIGRKGLLALLEKR